MAASRLIEEWKQSAELQLIIARVNGNKIDFDDIFPFELDH